MEQRGTVHFVILRPLQHLFPRDSLDALFYFADLPMENQGPREGISQVRDWRPRRGTRRRLAGMAILARGQLGRYLVEKTRRALRSYLGLRTLDDTRGEGKYPSESASAQTCVFLLSLAHGLAG